MSNLSVFQFESQEVRFVNGKPVANDVAKVLGYKDPSNAVSRLVKPKNKGVCDLQTPGGTQSVTVLEEPKTPYRPTESGKQWAKIVSAVARDSEQTVFQLRWTLSPFDALLELR